MELYLIRHGKTKGNGEGRYIGSTDEPLSAEGRRELTEVLWKGGYRGLCERPCPDAGDGRAFVPGGRTDRTMRF